MIQLQVFPLKWQSYSRLFQLIKQHKNFAVVWKKILNWLLVLQPLATFYTILAASFFGMFS